MRRFGFGVSDWRGARPFWHRVRNSALGLRVVAVGPLWFWWLR